MKYEISFSNHLKALDLLLLYFGMMVAFICYEIEIDDFDLFLRKYLIVCALLIIIPTIYLHLEYYLFSRGNTFEIDEQNKKLIYTCNTGSIETYYFTELSKIIVYMPPHFHSTRFFARLPFDTYHYARIYTKGGKELIITSLQVSKVMNAIEKITGVPIEKKKWLLASIMLSKPESIKL